MCARYVNVASTADLSDELGAEEIVGADLAPSWNIAPTDPVRVIMKRRSHGSDSDARPVRQLRTVRWGLVPSWSKTPSGGARMINARSETVASKPAFKAAAARRRCLAPSLGYFEWKHDGGHRIPYFLHAPNDQTLALAGLYEIWRDDSLPEDDPNRWIWSCTIITRPATDLLGEIHDRCPVLVPRDLREQWLDCDDDDPAVAQRLLEAMPEPHLVPRLVSKAVGNVKNNGPALIEPADDAEQHDDLPPLSVDDAPATEPTPQQLF